MELSLLRLKKYHLVQYYSFQEKVLPKVMTFYFHIFLRFFVHFVILSQFTVRCVCVFIGGGGGGGGGGGAGAKRPPYQFFPCNIYKRRN